MPKRKAAEMLPPQLKQWLDDELVRRGFSDYIQLAADRSEERRVGKECW